LRPRSSCHRRHLIAASTFRLDSPPRPRPSSAWDTLSSQVKLLKQPKFDVSKLMELHSASTEAEVGAKVQRTEFVEPAVLESV